MAAIDPNYDEDEERRRREEEERRNATPPSNTPPPGPSYEETLKKDPHAEAPGVNEMIERDRGSWEARLRESARNAGVGYDASDLEGVVRQASYARNVGHDPDEFLRQVEAQYGARAVNRPGGVAPPTSPGPVNDPRLAPGGNGAQNHNVFSDALTRQLEQFGQGQLAAYQNQQAMLQRFLDPLIAEQQQLVQAQRAQYEQQRKALEEAAAIAAQRRSQTGQAVDRLSGYINERVGRLQGPAYTGTEQEVIRTQALDPLERDRAAARQRALQTIGGRGYELDSGVAQELLAAVDREFNQARTGVQGNIAQRQIEEQRSREQEAQQLLQYLASLPDATARGDLEYVTYVQNLLNQPRQASLATGMAGGTGVAQLADLPNQPGMQGLGIAEMLADLPTKRLHDALATLGIGGSPAGATSSLIQLLDQQSRQRALTNANAAQYWANIGRSFMP